MFLCRKLFCDIKTRAERSEVKEHSSSAPRTLFYFNYMFARLLSLKQILTFSVGERLGAPDVANKSHLHSRLRTFTK